MVASTDNHAPAQTLKTIEKRGLDKMAKEAGVDLKSLPYTDVRPQRLEWVAKQPKYPAMVRFTTLCACWLPAGPEGHKAAHVPCHRVLHASVCLLAACKS